MTAAVTLARERQHVTVRQGGSGSGAGGITGPIQIADVSGLQAALAAAQRIARYTYMNIMAECQDPIDVDEVLATPSVLTQDPETGNAQHIYMFDGVIGVILEGRTVPGAPMEDWVPPVLSERQPLPGDVYYSHVTVVNLSGGGYTLDGESHYMWAVGTDVGAPFPHPAKYPYDEIAQARYTHLDYVIQAPPGSLDQEAMLAAPAILTAGSVPQRAYYWDTQVGFILEGTSNGSPPTPPILSARQPAAGDVYFSAHFIEVDENLEVVSTEDAPKLWAVEMDEGAVPNPQPYALGGSSDLTALEAEVADLQAEVEDILADLVAQASAIAARQLLSEKDQADGYAGLDGDGLLLDSVIPLSIVRTSAMEAAISAAVGTLVSTAPGVLDTLAELATALGNDPSFATTVATSIATKVSKDTLAANQILKADTSGTPVGMTVGEATLVGRLTGGSIAALTVSQVKSLLSLAIADVTGLQTALDGKQAVNANLTAMAALTNAADKLPYFNGTDMSTTDLTSAARSLLAQTTTTAMRNYLSAQVTLPMDFGTAAGDTLALAALTNTAGNAALSSVAGSTSQANNRYLFFSFVPRETFTISALLLYFSGANSGGSGTSAVQFYIMADHATTRDRPGVILRDCGSASITTIGLKEVTLGSNFTFTAGTRYYIAWGCRDLNTGGSVPVCMCFTSSGPLASEDAPGSIATAVNPYWVVTAAGGLTDNPSVSRVRSNASQLPWLYGRVA